MSRRSELRHRGEAPDRHVLRLRCCLSLIYYWAIASRLPAAKVEEYVREVEVVDENCVLN